MSQHILNSYFDKIFVLYITATELERIKDKLINMKINAEYFKGINGRTELMNEFTTYIKNHESLKSKEYIRTVGAYGHVHSFINILNNAIKNKYKKILILEPDIYFSIDFNTLIKKYISLDYKLLYLGASQHYWNKIDTNQKNKNLMKNGLYNAQDTYGTFALGIDCSIYNEYLVLLKNKINPSDLCLCKIHNKYPDKCYVTYPNIISCDVTKSTTVTRWRSQEELIKKFRWNRNYLIYDRFSFDVKINCIYKIVVEINHTEKNKKQSITILDEYGDIAPIILLPNDIINEKKLRKCNNVNKLMDEYIIYVYTKLPKLFIRTENIYCDTIHIIEYFNNVNTNCYNIYPHLKQKFNRYINSKNIDIVNYYENILDDIFINV